MDAQNIIEKKSFVPKYYQLIEIIKEMIRTGKLKRGMRILSENELKEKYKVSNTTVRKAINELLHEGTIYREQGRGTFVARTVVNQELTRISSFTEDMLQRGLKPSSKVISVTVILIPPKMMSSLILNENEEVIRVHRLRLANGQPMAIQTSYIPHKFCARICDEDLTKSLTVILENRYNLRLVKAVQVLYPSLADDYYSKMLMVSKGAPVLIAERTSYLKDNRPVEFIESVYRGDRYKFSIELRR